MSDITLTFPDGASRAYAQGITGKALAESIAKTLARRAVAMVLDGRIADLADPITSRRQGANHHPYGSGGARADPP